MKPFINFKNKTILIWSFFILCGFLGSLPFYGVSSAVNKKQTETVSTNPVTQSQSNEVQSAIEKSRTASDTGSFVYRSISFMGLFGLVGICYLLSRDRKRINWRLVAWGMALQLIFGIFVLKTAPGLWLFAKLNDGVMALLGFTKEGSDFLFRSFVSGKVDNSFVNFTFNVLPTIIFFSSFMTVMYYAGIMQKIVNFFTLIMQKTMKTSGAETLSTAANIFVGQTEAPLVIKPYVNDMTMSELMAVMVGGFANTAGGVLAAYVGMLHQYFPDIAGHLIAQSVMSAPAALVCAKIVYPEDGQPRTAGINVHVKDEKIDANIIDAAARGASEGLGLSFNVAAMLLAFIALIAMANAITKYAGGFIGFPALSLEYILGIISWPVAWLMGVPSAECFTVGKLIGVKTVLNEFVAYMQMTDILKAGDQLSYRSIVICTYALSGFSNFASIAIQIGGISGIAPKRRHDLAKLGLSAMIVGSIATFMTATIAGILM